MLPTRAVVVAALSIGVIAVALCLTVTTASTEKAQLWLTAVLVLVTTAYLLATLWIAHTGQRSAEATRQMADDARAQRASMSRPYVVCLEAQRCATYGAEAYEFMVKTRNVGVGPALGVDSTFRHDMNEHAWSVYIHHQVPAVSVGETVELKMGFGSGWAVPGGPNVPGLDHPVARGVVLVNYKDVEGNAWQTQCEVLLPPPRLPGDSEALPVFLLYDTNTVQQVRQGEQPAVSQPLPRNVPSVDSQSALSQHLRD